MVTAMDMVTAMATTKNLNNSPTFVASSGNICLDGFLRK